MDRTISTGFDIVELEWLHGEVVVATGAAVATGSADGCKVTFLAALKTFGVDVRTLCSAVLSGTTTKATRISNIRIVIATVIPVICLIVCG
jgi:hypothetical protein